MDEADRAQAYMEQDLEARIRAARGIIAPARESASECIECGAQIPSARQIAVPGCQLCVECSAAVERAARRGGL